MNLSDGASYAALVGVPAAQCGGSVARVAPGQPGASYLLDALQGTSLCGGYQMPFDDTPLSSSQIATILAWICEGAPND